MMNMPSEKVIEIVLTQQEYALLKHNMRQTGLSPEEYIKGVLDAFVDKPHFPSVNLTSLRIGDATEFLGILEGICREDAFVGSIIQESLNLLRTNAQN
jgi:hypothetical protein